MQMLLHLLKLIQELMLIDSLTQMLEQLTDLLMLKHLQMLTDSLMLKHLQMLTDSHSLVPQQID